jgi:hypothetical protein
MNERIKELAHEVFSFKYKTSPYELNPSHRMDHLHKFAELIVWECVRYLNEDYQRDFDTLWREDLSKGIKEHFGVEE